MRPLIYSEFTRLWSQRWLWLVILAAPFLAYLQGSYFIWVSSLGHNVSSVLFLFQGLREMLFLPCNIAVAALAAAVYTEPFRSGQLRLLFLRRFSKGQIFFSKLFVLQASILLLLLVLGISLAVVGMLRFPQEEAGRFWPLMGYAFVYYLLAYATLAGISCLFSFIAMYSKNVTLALGVCMTYILVSLLFDGLYLKVASLFSAWPYVRDLLAYGWIPFMQHTGLNEALSGNASVNWAIPTILLLHVVVCSAIAYRRFVAEDYMH
ncbi:ABC transporter permease [Paenibacillus ehimensis]|uniref:ABC transporter permease n=1 Tax=Paenibacillus ehimensis TaxID=79264 RepID=UPI000FD913B8|nr:ABC transporter permease [Paenibacillus ehimensis]